MSRAVEYLIGNRAFVWLTSNSDALMIGCIAAIGLQACPEALRRIAAWHPALGRVIAVAVMAVPVALSSHLLIGWFTVMAGPTLQALAAGYLVCSFVLHRQGAGYTLLNLKPVVYMGVLSYSLYIWQEPFFSQASVFGDKSSILLIFPFNLISALLVAMLSYHLLERPLANLRNRFRPSAPLQVTAFHALGGPDGTGVP